MLLRAFFLIFLFSLLTVTTISATAMFSKVLIYNRALGYLPAGYQMGLASVTQSFAGGTFVAATPAPASCVSNDAPCSFYASQATIAPSQTAPSATASCASAGVTNCAANLQKQVIDEKRMGLQLQITILDANKSPLVSRTKFLTLRTFGVAPYYAVIGERDGAQGDRAPTPEGENAGLPSDPMQAGTLIKVQYHDTTGANPDTEHNTWTTQGWSSGNSTPSAWSQ